MPTRNFDIPEHFDQFIKHGIQAGRFTDVNGALLEGLRLLEEHEKGYQAKVEWLREAAKVGFDQLDRGEGIEFESMEDLRTYLARIGDEVTAELKAERKRKKAITNLAFRASRPRLAKTSARSCSGVGGISG